MTKRKIKTTKPTLNKKSKRKSSQSFFLIIVTGLPGVGKTTLSEKMAKDLNLPLFCKDKFKEILFDSLNCKDGKRSRQLGGGSYDLMWYATEAVLKSGRSLVIESNFETEFASRKINRLQAQYGFKIIQIRLFAEGKTLFERFKRRALSAKRHPGHCDGENLIRFEEKLKQGKAEALKVKGDFFDIDTTDFKRLDYDGLIKKVTARVKV